MTIPEIFAAHGEPYFRAGEARVIARLLDSGPQVLATGGGAFMREETRDRIRAKAVSIWLKADADVLMRRVRRRADRPLLQTADPGGDRRPPDRRARAGLCRGRPHGAVARRAARQASSTNASRRCAPGSAAAPRVAAANRRDRASRHDRAAETFRSDHRRRRARRPRL